jgi:hypothetical protein
MLITIMDLRDVMRRDARTCGADIGSDIMKDMFHCVKIPKDGFCLFTSVCFSLLAKLGVDYARRDLSDGGLSRMSDDLRHRVCVEISDSDLNLKDEYRSFIYENEEGLFGATVDNYVKKLFDGEVFGGHLELLICSKILRVCIIVTQHVGDTFTCTPVGIEFFKGMGACIYVVLRKLHYNSLVFKSQPL